MEASVHNVVGLNSRSVWEDIRTHIESFESKRTSENYERSLRIFYKWYRGKDIELLNKGDLSIRNADVLKYRKYLENHPIEYGNSSINTMIAAIQSLYGFLERNDYNVKAAVTKVKPLPDDSERAGFFHEREINQITGILEPTVKGYEKAVFCEMAWVTSFRKASLLSLKWEDISFNNETGNYKVTATVKGGEKHSVDIPDELYKRLLHINELAYYDYNDNKIFHLSNTTIQNMMQYIIEKLEIEPERNIRFHSFRNFASMFGTLEELRRHYKHSSIVVTDKYYGRDKKNKSSDIGLRIADKIDDSVFEGLSKEELIILILSQNESALFQMKREAKKIIDNKNNKDGVE
ncbi:tyrosine-type recombinase/integrase [Paenibacillus spiritus]|nr:site-specific integrase [Paenibacillus spiritus]